MFASRRPDPVLQQVEDFADGTVSANDCFRPVSRYFDRITRPEQLIDALPQAMATLLDPARCGPVTLAFCQDVQAQAWDWPIDLFAQRKLSLRRPRPDRTEVEALVTRLKAAAAPLIIVGGGVAYAGAEAALARLALEAGIPFAETQAGKGALAWDHPMNLGAIGVTGTAPANAAAGEADLIIGIGTRLQDFTTGSRALFAKPGRQLVQINASAFDAAKQGALAVVGDAGEVLVELGERLAGWTAPADWTRRVQARLEAWDGAWTTATAPSDAPRPSDAQVMGAVWAKADESAVVVCAAGGLPGELHKLWRTRQPGGYHVEYGYSCMGYEIAGGLGVKLAAPQREVHVLVGDGSYLMMNSEIATSVMLGGKLIITVFDNRGYGCIHRLQQSVGGAPFNNLLADARAEVLPQIDFAAHAASMGAAAEKVASLDALGAALDRAKASDRTYVIVIDTDPLISTAAGGAWWDVPAPAAADTDPVPYESRSLKP